MEPLPLVNPFWKNVVAGAYERVPTHVQSIHSEPLKDCLSVIERVRATNASASIVVHGGPGSGKTHLLARIKAQMEEDHLGDAQRMAKVVYIRLNTTSRRLWRHLREQMIEDLLQAHDGHPWLDWLLALHAGPPEQDRAETERWHVWLRQPHPDERGIDEFLSPIAGGGQLHAVLRQWMLGSHVSDARAWLRGESLPQAALDRLGVGAEDAPDADEAEARAHIVVRTLCRLVRRVPFVFCFDQLEALGGDVSTAQGFQAYGRMASDLFDSVSNAAIVSCIQTSYVTLFMENMFQPHRERISQREVALNPITPDQGRQLIRMRLDSLPDLREMRKGKPELWPLKEKKVAALLRGDACYPRKILAECARLYEEARTGAAPALATPAEFVAAEVSRRNEAMLARNLRDEADAVLSDGLPDLLRIVVPDATPSKGPRAGDVEFSYDRGGRTIALSLCNHKNATSLAARLRRLVTATEKGQLKAAGLVLLRHPHLPIAKTAKASHEHLAALTAKGARLQQPTPEALALLAVLRDILSDARAGDLARDGEAVPPDSVEAWFRERCPRELKDLAEELFASPAADPLAEVRQDLLEWLDDRKLAPLEDAAKGIERPLAQVEECVVASPSHFGRLPGPPVVVYLHVPDSIEGEA